MSKCTAWLQSIPCHPAQRRNLTDPRRVPSLQMRRQYQWHPCTSCPLSTKRSTAASASSFCTRTKKCDGTPAGHAFLLTEQDQVDQSFHTDQLTREGRQNPPLRRRDR